MKNTFCQILAFALTICGFGTINANARIVEEQTVDFRCLAEESLQLNNYEFAQGNIKVLVGRQFNNDKYDYPRYDAEGKRLICYTMTKLRIETLIAEERIDSIHFNADVNISGNFSSMFNSAQLGNDGDCIQSVWKTYEDKSIGYLDFYLLYPNGTHIEIAYLYDITVFTSREGEPDPEPDPAPMSMELIVDEAYGHMATVGIVKFTLNVANDDGIKNFTLLAHNPDDAEQHYCNIEFDRNSFAEGESAVYSDEEDPTATDRDYTISGTARLTKLGRNQLTPIHIYALANYEDGTSKSTAEPVAIEVDTSGLTGACDVEADDAAAPEYYNLQGIRVAAPSSPGIYIVRRGAATSKIAFMN